MPQQSYDDTPGMNFSTLKYMAVSPLEYKHRKDTPQGPKDDFALGNAFHTLVLEPETFDDRYAIWTRRTDAGKMAPRRGQHWDKFQQDHKGKEFLREPEERVARLMADALFAHEEAAKEFKGGRREEALQWVDEETGVHCKGKVDYIKPIRVTDLKSCPSITERDFVRKCCDMLYYVQVAFYHDGAIASGRMPRDAAPPRIVAQEKRAPFDVGIYELNYEDLETGRLLYRHLLKRVLECEAADFWPGKMPQVEQLKLPSWAPGMEIPTPNYSEGDEDKWR